MAKTVIIQHPTSGLTKNGFYGFSWTYFFFGWLVPIFRGEIGIGILHLIFSMFTLGIFQIIMAFLYNKQYMSRMLEKGYVLKDSEKVMAEAKIALGIVQENDLPKIADTASDGIPNEEESTKQVSEL